MTRHMVKKSWAVKRLTLNLTTEETRKLESYCAKTGRTATDVVRELIRRLPEEESVLERRLSS